MHAEAVFWVVFFFFDYIIHATMLAAFAVSVLNKVMKLIAAGLQGCRNVAGLESSSCLHVQSSQVMFGRNHLGLAFLKGFVCGNFGAGGFSTVDLTGL